jgi:DNA-binding LacI/PurR family transcriptional regulator
MERKTRMPNAKRGKKQGKHSAAQPTINDIAKLAGVSTATVSYVINGKSGVSDDVRARVLDIMHREGYTRNLRAKGLKTGRSYTLHAVIRKEAAPACKTFYFSVIACMAERLSPGSYSIVPVFQSDDDSSSALTDIIRNGDTDGVISFQGVGTDIADTLEGMNIPYIIVNPGFEKDTQGVSVKIDFEKLAYRATSYLASAGHTDIALIGMRSLPFFFNATKKGFRRAMKEHGLTVRKEWLRGEATCSEGAADSMHILLSDRMKEKTGATPTAVFCAQDNFAISAMAAATAEGYRVPEDISFIGLDDVPEAKYLNPPLTTISISPKTLASETLDRIFLMIDGAPTESITIPSGEVITRDSVARLK